MRIIGELTKMTSTMYLDRARGWGKALEDREAARLGQPVKDARASIARRTGIAPGTLENLRNGRLKAIAAHVYDRLWLAVERELRAEVRRLESELETHVERRLGADPVEVEQITADLEKVRAALNPKGVA